MKTLRAVNTIVMTIEPGKAGDKAKGIAPVRPKSVQIMPKTRFKAQNAEQEKELLDMGAAVVAEAVDEDAVADTAVVKSVKPSQKDKVEKAEADAKAKAEADAAAKADAGDGGNGDGSDLV